jgi:hypothetical protein
MRTPAKITLLAFGLLLVLLFTRFFAFGFVHGGYPGPSEAALLAQVSRVAIKVYLAEIAIFVGLGAFLLQRRRTP